jgi:DNA-binding Xre family transcriptional regulator
MGYNYAPLLGRIKECGLNQGKLAEVIGINEGTLSGKFNGKTQFTQKDIDSICEVLDISNTDIGKYFFTK